MKRMKQMKLPPITLPPELCSEILSKLPTKSLIRFRCVSKTWKSLIDEPNFVSSHLTNFESNLEKSRLIVIEPPNMSNAEQKCTIRCGENFRKNAWLTLDVTWYENYQVVGYINGVLCMKKYSSENKVCGVFLWNPSIRSLMELPLPRMSIFGSRNVDLDFAFGFDPIRNEYKVIASLYAAGKFQVPFYTELYTLGKGFWRDIKFRDAQCQWSNIGPKAFLNGVTYWTGNTLMSSIRSSKGYCTHFVAFDASSDVFNYIELPDSEDVNAKKYQRYPVILRQSIALIEIFGTYSYIWVMEEFGVTKSWTKKYTINLQLRHRFLHLKTNGDLLFIGERKGVEAYNIESQETTVLAKSYKLTSVFTDIYIESLTLLNHVHEC